MTGYFIGVNIAVLCIVTLADRTPIFQPAIYKWKGMCA